MKLTAKTLQERFGFADPELTTPAHDALMMWMDGTIEEWFDILPLKPAKWDWTVDFQKNVHTHAVTEQERAFEQRLRSGNVAWPPMAPVKMIHKRWEVPILGRNEFTIGFVDMRVTYSIPRIEFTAPDFYNFSWKEYSPYLSQCFFEVKPHIPSLGELIRQIRMYQTYTDGKWFVVSPDNKFASMLEGQGIGFVEAPKDL